jgi:hypothetical protein
VDEQIGAGRGAEAQNDRPENVQESAPQASKRPGPSGRGGKTAIIASDKNMPLLPTTTAENMLASFRSSICRVKWVSFQKSGKEEKDPE